MKYQIRIQVSILPIKYLAMWRRVSFTSRKYPVIFLTFKDVKFDTWDATIDKIRGLLQEEYGRHQELLNSDKLSQYEKEYLQRLLALQLMKWSLLLR